MTTTEKIANDLCELISHYPEDSVYRNTIIDAINALTRLSGKDCDVAAKRDEPGVDHTDVDDRLKHMEETLERISTAVDVCSQTLDYLRGELMPSDKQEQTTARGEQTKTARSFVAADKAVFRSADGTCPQRTDEIFKREREEIKEQLERVNSGREKIAQLVEHWHQQNKYWVQLLENETQHTTHDHWRFQEELAKKARAGWTDG